MPHIAQGILLNNLVAVVAMALDADVPWRERGRQSSGAWKPRWLRQGGTSLLTLRYHPFFEIGGVGGA